MTDGNRPEQQQDPDAGDIWDREDPRPAPPPDPEHDELIAAEEDLPSDDEEFASPPPDDPECRLTPDEPS